MKQKTKNDFDLWLKSRIGGVFSHNCLSNSLIISTFARVWCQTMRNFYYCRLSVNEQQEEVGCQTMRNFYYCRSIGVIVARHARCQTMRNFYYCRFGSNLPPLHYGVRPCEISTIVDPIPPRQQEWQGVRPCEISTIVDAALPRCSSVDWCQTMRNFYYCR